MAYRSCKFVLLGQANVGKTAVALRFLQDKFLEDQPATIGAAFMARIIELDQDTKVHINLWDTAGSERYKSIAPMYFRDSDVAIICYDLTRPDTVPRALDFVRAVKETRNPPLLFVAACKKDLVSEPYLMPESLREYACDDHIHLLSAKKNLGVHALFAQIAEKLVRDKRIKEYPMDKDVVHLTAKPETTTLCHPRCHF